LPGLLIEAERLAKWVILDTPPLGEVSDALRLAGECEPIVVMVVRLRHTGRSKLALARDLLTRVKVTTVGTVLIGQQAATLRGSYYGYRYAQASYTRRPRIPKRRPSPPDAAPVSDSGD
jgi:Mrp family chromosome partitioning ATPase